MKSKKFWIIVGIAAAIFITAGVASGVGPLGLAKMVGSKLVSVLGQIVGKLASVIKTVGHTIKTAGAKIGQGVSKVFGAGSGTQAGTSGLQQAAMNAGGAAHQVGTTGGTALSVGSALGGPAVSTAQAATGLGGALKGIFTNPYVAATIIGKGVEGAGRGIMTHAAQSSAERRSKNIGDSLDRYSGEVGPIDREDWSSLWTGGAKPQGDGIQQNTYPSVNQPVAPGTMASPASAPSTRAPSASLLRTSSDEILTEERAQRNGTA